MEAAPVYPETRPECFRVPAAVVPAFSSMPVCRDNPTNGLYHVFGLGRYRYTLKAQKVFVGLCSACACVPCCRCGLIYPEISGYAAGTQARANERMTRKQGGAVGVFAGPWYQDTGKTKAAYIAV